MSQSLSVLERSHTSKSRNHRNAPVRVVRSKTDIWIGKCLFVTSTLCAPLVLLRPKTDPRILRWVQGCLLRNMVSPFRLDVASHNCIRCSFARGITGASAPSFDNKVRSGRGSSTVREVESFCKTFEMKRRCGDQNYCRGRECNHTRYEAHQRRPRRRQPQ